MNYVIGSGPAGVSAASALLEQGLPVTMLDAGGRLESPIQSRVDLLAGRLPEQWSDAERQSVKGSLRYNTEGAPLKLAFGSDYAYRDVAALQPVVADGVDAYRSLATGGLSTLWGAAVLPYADRDFEGWPLNAADMIPHYISALTLTGLAAEQDALSSIYPLHMAPTARLEVSAQARHVAKRMTENAAHLHRQHVYFGRARLAIQEPSTTTTASCVHCGMCLYGCPYGLIYSARTTLERQLAGSRGFTYVPGFIVRRVTERYGAVTIDAMSRDTLEPRQFEASRVYLAAGLFASTAILLESLRAYDVPVSLKQSDHFLLPLALRASVGRVARERLHTLSQLFIEILDHAISRRGVHVQLYTYNDFYARMAEDRLGALYPLLAPAVERLIERVVLMKGYLHSEDSSGIRATLRPQGDTPVLHLHAEANATSDTIIGKVTTLLRRNTKHIGAYPLRLGLRKGRPGSGAHVGGSFPMRRHPRHLESDVLGRPAGLTRVHAVDATVLPSVAAVPPTLTIMANAFRIAYASQQCGEDPTCPS
jgi:choline dehydrogenase-like flavoprotein